MRRPSTRTPSGQLTFWPGDSPASPSAGPAPAAGPTTPAGCGQRSRGWHAHYDPAMCSWKTCRPSDQRTGAPRSGASSLIWPRAGTAWNGTASARPTSGPRTNATGSGWWPTPNAGGFNLTESPATFYARRERWRRQKGYLAGIPLGIAVQVGESWREPQAELLLPSPTASEDHYRIGGDRIRSQQARSLGALAAREGRALAESGQAPAGGQLSPAWVEWLMGFPAGWTDCGHLEMRSCPKSRKPSGH